MSEDLLNIVRSRFSYLFDELGFVVDKIEEFDAFDNSILLIKSKDFYIEFERDRGIISAAIASIKFPNKYFELSFVKRLIENRDVSYSIKLDDQIEFLRKNYLIIKKVFSKKEFEKNSSKLKALKQEWLKWKYPDAFK
jgi:hypothetical protein